MCAEQAEKFEFPERVRIKPETAKPVLDLYQDFARNKIAAEWLKQLQRSSLAAIEQFGLPQPDLERWKYTNLARAVKKRDLGYSRARMTFNGHKHYITPLQDLIAEPPQWLREMLTIAAPGHEKYGDMVLWDVANAFLWDGAVIDIPDGVQLEEAIEITTTGHDNYFYAPRLVIRLGEGASAEIIEKHDGEGDYWKNPVTQIELGDNARLNHHRLQNDTPQALHSHTMHVVEGKGSSYEHLTLTVGSALSRNQVHAELRGEEGHCKLHGISMLKGKQHGDMTTLVEHQKSHGTSDQQIRSVLDDKAHGVFQGKVHVHEGAQKTDGYQLSNALVLDQGAEMDTKPELEIFADDVVCSHGATTGQLDDQALFYLRSRGLPEQEARALVIRAFLGELSDQIANQRFHDLLDTHVERWLEEYAHGGSDA
jgi:Fe-S cluster assembly protein SufD